MQVDKPTLQYLENLVSTAGMFGIDSMIIEPGRVRGLHEDGTSAILHTDNVPDLDFKSVGLNRVGLFSSRYNMAKGSDDFTVDVTPNDKDDPQFARALTMKAKGFKVDYRCANPATIRAVKAFAGDYPKYKARMHPEAVVYMIKGTSAMQVDEATIFGSQQRVGLKMIDINGDELEYIFGENVDLLQGDEKEFSFSHRYPVKLLQTMFKGHSDSNFIITHRGLLRMPVNGLDVYVFPRV